MSGKVWVEKRTDPDRPDRSVDAAVSPFKVLTILVRRWRLVVFVPMATAVVAVGVAMAFGDYTARARFAPQSSGQDLGKVAGLAASFGIAVPGGGASEPIDFYVDLVKSSGILKDALLSEYRFSTKRDGGEVRSGNLIEILEIEGDTEEERIRNGVDALKDVVFADANPRSGLITLDTNAPWAELAEGMNARILDLLSAFDRNRRQGQARAEREFVEERLEAAHNDLRSAEAGLAAFLDRNRRPYQSPRLTMQLERQQRQVMLKQQLYGSLAQAFEEARIEEVRNTPVFTVVDQPQGSARGNDNLIATLAMALLLSGVLVVALVFALEYLSNQSGSADLEELRQTLRRLRRDPSAEESAA